MHTLSLFSETVTFLVKNKILNPLCNIAIYDGYLTLSDILCECVFVCMCTFVQVRKEVRRWFQIP